MTDSDRVVATQTLVDEIADRYGLGPVTDWADVGGGWTTNIRLGTTLMTMVARIHQHTTSLERVHAEQAAKRVLADAGIPTVVPIADDHGATVLQLGRHAVEVEPFVVWTDQMNTAPLLRHGFGLLARVHDVLRSADLPPAARTLNSANHIASARAAEATRRGAARLRGSGDHELARLADQVEEHIDAVARAEAAYADAQVVQVVHGDFWDNNVLFAGGPGEQHVVALLDFGFMAERPRVDDLALTVWFHLLQDEGRLPDRSDIETVAGFLAAYDAVTERPLSVAERASLPLAVARQPAWSIGGWVLEPDEPEAYRHARECLPEQPVADAVLADLALWQDVLAG